MGGRGTASNGQSSGCGGQQRLPLSRGWRKSRHIRQPACRAEASMGTQEPITRPASHVWEWTPLVLSAAGETSLIPGTRGSIRSLMQPLECQHILSLPGRDRMLFARLSVHFYLSGFHLDPSKLIQSPRGWNQEPGDSGTGVSQEQPQDVWTSYRGYSNSGSKRGGQRSHQGLGGVCLFPCSSALLSPTHGQLQGPGLPLHAGQAAVRKADAVPASEGLAVESSGPEPRRFCPGDIRQRLQSLLVVITGVGRGSPDVEAADVTKSCAVPRLPPKQRLLYPQMSTELLEERMGFKKDLPRHVLDTGTLPPSGEFSCVCVHERVCKCVFSRWGDKG